MPAFAARLVGVGQPNGPLLGLAVIAPSQIGQLRLVISLSRLPRAVRGRTRDCRYDKEGDATAVGFRHNTACRLIVVVPKRK